jgi:chromosome segregation ATPase
MTYLIGQIALCMLLAALIGWLVGRISSRIKYNSMVDELDSLHETNRELADYHQRTEAEFKELRADKARRLQVVTKQKSEISRLEDILASMESERNELSSQLREIKSAARDERDAIQNEKHEQSRQKKALEKEKSQLAEKFSEIDAQNEALKADIARLQHDGRLNDEQVKRLKSQNEKLISDNDSLRKDNLAISERRDALLAEQRELLARFTSLEKLHESEIAGKHQLLGEHTRLKEKFALLERENEEHKHQLSVINGDIEDLTTQIIDIRNERDGLSGTLRSIASIAQKFDPSEGKQG